MESESGIVSREEEEEEEEEEEQEAKEEKFDFTLENELEGDPLSPAKLVGMFRTLFIRAIRIENSTKLRNKELKTPKGSGRLSSDREVYQKEMKTCRQRVKSLNTNDISFPL